MLMHGNTKVATHLRIVHNGDPYGRGFVGSVFESRDAQYGTYLGDIGAMPRYFWRAYARRNQLILIEPR